MTEEHAGISEIVAVILMVVLVIIVAIIVGVMVFGMGGFMQKSAFMAVTASAAEGPGGMPVITLNYRQGDAVSLVGVPGIQEGIPVQLSLTDPSGMNVTMTPVSGMNPAWKPGGTVVLARGPSGYILGDHMPPGPLLPMPNGTWRVTIVDTVAKVLVFSGTVRIGAPSGIIYTTPPVANFTAPEMNPAGTKVLGFAGTPVQFSDTSVNATNWNWTFGDGSAEVSQQHPSHTYATSGTYVVRLNASNMAGNATAQKTIYVVPRPVAWWKFDGDGNDAVGGNNGAVYNGSYVAGKRGQALSFGGSTGKTSVEIASGSDLSATTALSIVLWANPSSTAAQALIGKGYERNANPKYYDNYGFNLYSSRTMLFERARNPTLPNSLRYRQTGTNVWSSNTWTMFSAVYGRGAPQNIDLYTGATSRYSGTSWSSAGSGGSGSISDTLPTNSYPVVIGREQIELPATNPVQSAAPYWFGGLMDDVMVFKVSLTPAEIGYLYAFNT